MPVIGKRQSTASMGNGYYNNPLSSYAQSFIECATDIMKEGVDLFLEPQKALALPSTRNALKNFYVESCCDSNEFQRVNPAHAAEMQEDAEAMAEAMFENDVDAIREHTVMGSMNPVIGMTFPLHKNIMMNNVFDKGAIPKFVAREPKFTISMEQRILVTPDGEEIDMFKDQYKIHDAIDSTAPFKVVEMTLPQTEGATDVLAAIGASTEDHLSIDTFISGVHVHGVYLQTGDINPETGEAVTSDGEYDFWLPTRLHFTPSYGNIDRIIAEEIELNAKDKTDPTKTIVMKDVISGFMRNDKFMISGSTGLVSEIRLSARLDTSSAMVKTCSVRWKVRTDIVEIGNANPINTTVSPEEVKDIGALYNVNQMSKILSLMKTVLGEYKDAEIKHQLDMSFETMPATNKFAGTFDFAPRAGYALDHVEWRYKTFMDYLDSVCTGLFQILNDPNMTVTVFGSPDLVRKITPTEYTYQTPSAIGPVELDYVKTVVTSDKRVYQFISSDKLRGNPNLIIVLCPRNTDRIVYRIYDYQMYVSNEIRNMANYALPAIHAFERWKFVEYQPVQARLQILNPTGMAAQAPWDKSSDIPYGANMSDFNMLK